MMNCPICTSDQSLNVIKDVNIVPRKRLNLKLVECVQCNHKFFFTSESDQRIIEESYDASYEGYRKDVVFESNLQKICGRLLKPANGRSKVLDVGCGRGDFLDLSTRLGYLPLGIDVSESAKEICLSRGLDAVAGDFLKFDFKDKFDVITFWDVMEHLQFPRRFISRAGELLNDGGVILIKVPYFSKLSLSFASRVPVLARVLLGAPNHIQFYTKKSLNVLGYRSGLQKIHIERIGSIRGEINHRGLGHRLKKAGISFVKGVFGDGNYLVVLEKVPVEVKPN